MPVNNHTSLLTLEENEQVIGLLKPKCRTLATTVVQLFTTRGMNSDQWYNEGAGVLCLVKDDSKRSYYFRILCLTEKLTIWEQEFYANMNYVESTPFFHTFEAHDCIAAFNFADENEGSFMHKTVLQVMKMVIRRTDNLKIPKSEVGRQNNVKGSDIKTQLPSGNNKSKNKEKNKKGGKGKKGKRPHLEISDIGMPHDFQHVGHVGWSTTNGPSLGLQLQKFLQKAGVSDSQLKDKDTWNFILDFITENGGMDAVAGSVDELTPTCSPGSRPRTTGPPAYPPPLLPKMATRPQPEIPDQSAWRQSGPPLPQRPGRQPPSATGAPVPPPPPPPAGISALPPPLPTINEQQEVPVLDNPRDLLLDAIRNGPKLKRTQIGADDGPKKSVDSPNNLLSQIREGITLKRVTEQPVKPARTSNDTGCLASVLKDALTRRLVDMNPDLDEPEELERSDTVDDWESD